MVNFILLFQDSFIHNCLILFLSLLSQISHKGTLVGSLWCDLGKTNEPFAQDAGGSLLLSTQSIGREHHFQCHVSTLQAQSLAGLCLLHARACSTGTSIRKVPPEFSTLLKNTCQLACMILQIACYKAAEQTCKKAGDMEICSRGLLHSVAKLQQTTSGGAGTLVGKAIACFIPSGSREFTAQLSGRSSATGSSCQ